MRPPNADEIPLLVYSDVVVMKSKDYAQDRRVAAELGAKAFRIKPMGIREIRKLTAQFLGMTASP